MVASSAVFFLQRLKIYQKTTENPSNIPFWLMSHPLLKIHCLILYQNTNIQATMSNNLLKKAGIMFLLSCMWAGMKADDTPLKLKMQMQTGAIDQLVIPGDTTAMNWLVKTDGSQYAWVKANYGWGLGYFTLSKGRVTVKKEWGKPAQVSSDGMHVVYQEGDIRIRVDRRWEGSDLIEQYTFINTGKESVSLYDIGIYTPLNDNYPNSRQCINARTNVQVWEGDNAAYVNALRMGAYAPHLGLVVTQGAVKSYEIWERGNQKANSHTRGIFALNLPDLYLRPNQTYTLEWHLFAHQGNEDFQKKLLERGSVLASASKYVYQKGETAMVRIESAARLKNVEAFINGVPVPVTEACADRNLYVVYHKMEEPGEARFTFRYNGNHTTHANVLVVSSEQGLLKKRVDFILNRQQMNRKDDPRYGAYMIYDNEGDSIYLNDTPNCNPVDRDEGAERVGMGVLLAKQYILTKDERIKESLLKYATFIREKLQTKDYVTYSSVDQKNRNRGYNYMWVADFYFLMYQATGDKQYAIYGYETMQSMFRQFGYGFYAIGIPVLRGLESLQKAGMKKEYKKLLNDFVKTGDVFVKNGLNYPAFEVNYEQSIVAPAIEFLAQLYLATKDSRYLEEVKRQMPVLEAFNGFQPSFHLNEVAIRHWDGYWFGKREMFGDTFPHYWSTITGAVYHYYYLCTGDKTYQQRAENVVRNNLCLFFEDGRASCAYLYPYKVNGEKAQFYDSYANDQDWALVYYLLVNENI